MEDVAAAVLPEVLHPVAGSSHQKPSGAAACGRMSQAEQDRPSVLRAARELGVSSSAVYRYIASRDELLTRLMVAAYDALGVAAEDAEATVAREDHAGRWAAVGHAVPAWALAHPNEYALVYGTPVPGYTAPSATAAPAARVSKVLLGILADATGRLGPTLADEDVAPDLRQALAPVRSLTVSKVPDALVQRGLMAWAALFGTVSFELFGQLHHIVGEEPGDRDAFFADCVRRWTTRVGIATPQANETYTGPTRERQQEVRT